MFGAPANGVDWTETTNNAAFPATDAINAFNYNDMMYIYSQTTDTFYTSTDGVDWTVVTTIGSPPPTRRDSNMILINNNFILAAGYNGADLKDVWQGQSIEYCFSATPTITQTITPTFTPTFTETATPTFTRTLTPTCTITPTCGLCVIYSDWQELTGNAQFIGRQFSQSVFYNNLIWLLTGSYPPTGTPFYLNDVWYSTDGVDWTAATQNANWTPRDDGLSLVYNNKLWVISGTTGLGQGSRSYQTADVWYSTDGVDWTAATQNAEFGKQYSIIGTIFNGYMWVITTSNGTWYSADGIAWTKSSTFQANKYDGGAVVAYGEYMYCSSSGTIYRSSDGITWTSIKTGTPFGHYAGMGMIIYKGAMWVIGSNINGVWSSFDGITWTQYNNSSFSQRNFFAIFSDINYLGIISGNSSGTYPPDVWANSFIQYCFSATPTITQTITPTFTPTFTETATPTFTKTIRSTNTPTVTKTNTPTITWTVTKTITPTITVTKVVTPRATNTPATVTPTITRTCCPIFHINTFTPTITPAHTYGFNIIVVVQTYIYGLKPTPPPTPTATVTATP